ncbi:J domain-containing protein [Megalodesulfovibrio paquesii]
MQRVEAYRILRLSDGAGLEQVKAAYRKLAFTLHPDLNPNDPQAARQFQRLNEAYVLLKQLLDDEGARRPSSGGGRGASREDARRETPSREEVLRDILKDPFARQVFEDIYREARQGPGETANPFTAETKPGATSAKQAASAYAAGAAAGHAGPGKPPPSASSPFTAASPGQPGKTDKTGKTGKAGAGNASKATPGTSLPKKRPRTMRVEWGEKKLHVDLSDGFFGAAKRWMRSWLDEEQVMQLPAVHLRPGVTVRLTVQQGVADATRAVDVVLPSDFVPGRPIRLKGLGRKFGPLKGDLYLRILAK